MINSVDVESRLTLEQRKSILNRALNSAPFFYPFQFDLVATFTLQPLFQARAEINLNFYITEVLGTDGIWNNYFGNKTGIRIYEQYTGRPIWGNATDFIPIPQAVGASYGDRLSLSGGSRKQFEKMPYRVNKGSSVVVQVQTNTISSGDDTAFIVLKGYNELLYPYINSDEQRLINESLAEDSVFQTFRIEVEDNVRRTYFIDNDRRPRLILGFTAVPFDITAAYKTIESEVKIYDTSRHLKWSDKPIRQGFFAPVLMRNVATQAINHIYYMPMEYYLPPMTRLQFDIDNTLNGHQDYQLIALTRTV